MGTTANNIANVNNENYERQVVRQETLVVGGKSVGVKISAVDRIVDRFLEAAGLTANASAQSASIQREFHDRLQGVIGRPDSGTTLTARIDAVFASFADLTLNPADRIVRQAALESVTDMTIEIARLSQNIQDLRNDASQRMGEEVNVVNEALKRVHAITPIIIRQKAIGGETAGLESQRSEALSEISEVMDIKTISYDDGRMDVLTGSGVTLLNLALRELEYVPPGVVTADTRFSPIKIHRLDPLTNERTGSSSELDPNIKSGRLRGLLDMRDGDLRNLSLSLGEFSATFMEEINHIHNNYSAFPPPNNLTGRATTIDGAHLSNFTGKTTFAVTDSSGKVVAEHQVDFDALSPVNFTTVIANINAGLGGNGTVALTGGKLSFTATNAANGVVIKDDGTTPSQRGGQSFSQFFGMNDLLEAKVSGNYKTGYVGTDAHNLVAGGQLALEVRDKNGLILNSHTMSVTGTTFNDQITTLNAAGGIGDFYTFALDANGEMTYTEKTGFSGLQLYVVSDTTNHNSTAISFSELFGLGDRFRVDPSKNIQVKEGILNNPERMALSSYDLTVGVGNVALSQGDQAGALALHGAQGALLKYGSAGELANMQVTFSQYASALLANAGLMGARATNKEMDASALKVELDQRTADISGVNLDEELAKMVQLQTSFNASARLITAADEMMQYLVDTI